MKYVKEFGIILIVSLVGELLNYFLPLPVPASIYGLVLMFLCLMLGIIKLSDVHDTACFLIEIMPLMFIPAAAGLVDVWNVVKPILLPLIIITIATTLIDIFAAGWVSQLIIRHRRKHNHE